MRGLMRSGYGRRANVPTNASGTPPPAVTSRSLSPVIVSIDERNDPAAALPARSIASTTAAPTATAAITSSDRAGSRRAGRTIRRKKSVMAAISGTRDAPVAHLYHRIDQRGGLGAMCGHQDGRLLFVAYPAKQ